jgi:hypothetical protein
MRFTARQAGDIRVILEASEARFWSGASRRIVGLRIPSPQAPGVSPGSIWVLDCEMRSFLCRCLRSRRSGAGSVVIAEVIADPVPIRHSGG